MRRPFLAGNWKMNLLQGEAVALARELSDRIGRQGDREVAVFPTFVSVAAVADALEGSAIRVGGQDCHPEASGAFTGAVGPGILRSAGASLVIVGHSERRQLFGETDDSVRRKVRAALDHGLEPIVCVGETREERERGGTLMVVERQVKQALAVAGDQVGRVTVAYEPVWAIGTGLTATPEQAQDVHGALRGHVRELFGDDVAGGMRILYGGSVKPSNVDGLMAMPDIDGALVGGASLEADAFSRIVQFESAPHGAAKG